MGGQNPVSKAVGAIGQGVQDSVFNPINQAANWTGDQVNNYGKNVSANLASLGQDLAVIGSGNFDNFGNTLLKAGAVLGTGGAISAKDAQNLYGQSTGERYIATKAAKAAEAAAADAQAVIDAQNRDVANTIQGVVTANKTTPGRRQTLINGPSARNNTLLTLIGA